MEALNGRIVGEKPLVVQFSTKVSSFFCTDIIVMVSPYIKTI